jgi:hypothetical protein
MEIINVIKDLLIALFWPILTLFIVITFKNELLLIIRKIARIDKFSYKDFTAEFGEFEIEKLKQSSKEITSKIVDKSDNKISVKLENYISEFALIDKLKSVILNYLNQYGVMNIDTAKMLIFNIIKDDDKTNNYIDIILDLLLNENIIKKHNNLILRIN